MDVERRVISSQVSDQISSIVVDREVTFSIQAQTDEFEDYEAYLDLFDAIRSEKDYDWESDISLPEAAANWLTQSAIDVGQYFKTRDFAECYISDDSDEAEKAADAAKECVNRTLNRRGLYHYLKFLRAKNINHMASNITLECWWEKELEMVEEVDETTGEVLTTQRVVKDHFNYDVHDPRNVLMSREYVYTIQDKKYMIIRDERTYSELVAEQGRHQYFDLEQLKKEKPQGDTQTKEAIGQSENDEPDDTLEKSFDRYRRFGKFWVKDGRPGIDEYGDVIEGAELKECIITVVHWCGKKHLIGFQETMYRDAHGNAFRPLIRGICYVHPTQDGGVGDGTYVRELQIAVNDTFNLGNDRTRLATIPTLKTRRNSVEDTMDTVMIKPGHRMELNDPDDVQEMIIQDNISGTMAQMGVLSSKIQDIMNIQPTTRGALPAQSSQTATAVFGAESNVGVRSNYKAMSFEYTVLTELYWMILQMTYMFAEDETKIELMGEKVEFFDPSLDYFYKPLSQSIETDQSKDVKIQRFSMLLGYVSQIQHPDTIKVVNNLLGKIFSLSGDEVENVAEGLFDSNKPMMEPGGVGDVAQQGAGVPTSNEYGMPQSGGEQMARQVGRP